MEVRAARVDKCDMLEHPGDFVLTTHRGQYVDIGLVEVTGIIFLCPCGCKEQWSLKFKNAVPADNRMWEWNGCQDKPTLSPSISKIVGCQWHGHLTDGVFKSC